MTINSGNRPNRVSGRPLPAFQLRLNAYDWSRSGDIRAIVADQFANPMQNYGFVVDLQYTGIAASVHFSSLNDDHAPSMHGASGPGRDMSGAPRLLVKVRLPAGTSAADIQAPPFANAGDPLGAPIPFRMIVDTGADWPRGLVCALAAGLASADGREAAPRPHRSGDRTREPCLRAAGRRTPRRGGARAVRPAHVRGLGRRPCTGPPYSRAASASMPGGANIGARSCACAGPASTGSGPPPS